MVSSEYKQTEEKEEPVKWKGEALLISTRPHVSVCCG